MIKLEVLDKNPLSLIPLLAKQMGYFERKNVAVEIDYVPSFPAFDMRKVTANVGDTTRIFERIASGEDLIITSDLTRTMKLILREDYKEYYQSHGPLKILAANSQSLGIYTEFYLDKIGIEFEYVIEVNMQKRVELIRSGQVDGACMIDPFLIEFIGNGYLLAYEGKDHPHNYTCWAFHREYHRQNPGAIVDFHTAMNEAIYAWNQMSKGQKYQVAQSLLVVPSHLQEYYENLEFTPDQAYKEADLATCYEWKVSKNPGLSNLDLMDVLLSW